ncbi:hypothetical protein KAK07_00435 [Ideonella sp. 4Y16]|uniref:SH3 domain-containing protein n=1 Tax=Ideonella alba TaxID=2824118 RepID=A0A940YFX4_9BURK|nr:hypothetical protein [Ideonella alba]MBQ0931767.1 hypothetical protein [Ideonella alba]MBQ0941789.1 hypothetical protein [Ideonella alba]
MPATTLAAATLAALALVGPDGAALRASPHDNAALHAQLTPGDTLELRGERLDHWQVWDHRRERGGFVKRSQLRVIGSGPQDAPGLLAVLRFLRDQPGAESLAIGYAAAYLQAVPARELGSEPFELIGTLAERLARRASAAGASDPRLAAQLDAVAAYGVRLQGMERDGRMRLCYDGAAWRQVLAMPQAGPEARGRAVLGLSRPECIDPALPVVEQDAQLRQHATLLGSLPDSAVATLPTELRQRLQMRRAAVWSALAFQQARRGEDMRSAGEQAGAALAAVDKAQLPDEDQADYTEAAVRVGASRWAAQAPIATPASSHARFITRPGRPGETCVLLIDAAHAEADPLLRRCTWGVAWAASAASHPRGEAATIAVQPLATWRELWLARRTAQGWTLEVLPPVAGNPLGEDLGYVEAAGWTAEPTPRLLLAREARTDGRWQRRFEVVQTADLSVERQASTPDLLLAFKRWADPVWRRDSVALR